MVIGGPGFGPGVWSYDVRLRLFTIPFLPERPTFSAESSILCFEYLETPLEHAVKRLYAVVYFPSIDILHWIRAIF